MIRGNQKVVLLTGSPLCTNPRAVKEADALSELGFDVEILGRGDIPRWVEQDKLLYRNKKWKFSPLFKRANFLEKTIGKTKRLLGNQSYKWLHWDNHWQLAPLATSLLSEGRTRNAFLYIAHSEAGMWAAEELRKEGRTVGVDMEDWFSEDLLPEARRNRPIRLLKTLEKNLLCHGVYSSCTSEAMADALVKEYGCSRPVVVRNVFPLKDREGLDGKWKDRPGMAKWMDRNDPNKERPKEAPVSIHWFSQTIGPGRGLEMLFQTLDGMEGSWELHLRGNLKGYDNWLEQRCPASVLQRLKVHNLVSNDELLSRIAEHDIGYCGEPKSPPNKNLTISNKLFQYIQAGLAMVASDTAGQKEAARKLEGVVDIFSADSRTSLREKVTLLVGNPVKREKAKKKALEGFYSVLNWDKEKYALTRAIAGIG